MHPGPKMDGFPYSVLNLLMVLVRHHFPKLNCDRMMKVSNGERMAAAKPKLGSVWLRIQLSIQYPLRWSGGWLIQVVDDWSGSHYQNGLALFLVDLFSAPPSWGCMCMEEWWVDVEFAGWHVLRAFRCAPLAWTSNLWPIVFSCFFCWTNQ